MTDRYEKIRKALAKGPTPGPWELRDDRTDTVENAQGYPVCTVHWHPDERYGHGTRAAYIAACDPDTIRELLAERDQLAAALVRNAALEECAPDGAEKLREQLRLTQADMALTEAEVNYAHDEIKRLRGALAELISWFPSEDAYRRLGFDPAEPMGALEGAKAALARWQTD